MLVHALGDESGPAFGAGTANRALAERGETGTVLGANPLDREPPLRRRRDVLVHVARHLVAASVPDVLLLERRVPDRGVASERGAEGDVEGHRVVELVCERVDLGVVHLVRVELLRPLALLRMPKLVEDGRAAQASHLSVVGGKVEEQKVADCQTVPVEQHPTMLQAIANGFNDLIAIGTFADIELPNNRKSISSRILLKVKHRADGAFGRCKVRLVDQGFLQKLGVDFF